MLSFVIFGASGNLTTLKLIPALFRLFQKGRLPADTRIVGFSRTRFAHEAWRETLLESAQVELGERFDIEQWHEFARLVFYHPGDINQPDDFRALARVLDELEAGQPGARVYYLATAPQFYEQAVQSLGASGLADEARGPRRLVIEKPFGYDLASAHRLNEAVHRVFSERQIYRIDHYLGKETVQNLLVLRFANSIFEPVWNRNYIDHVQITVAEKVAVGDRAGYYDQAGVLRDMFQNHLMQLLMVTAMETPVRFKADLVRDEKVKVLQAIRPLAAQEAARDAVRGRYRGYLDEPGVPRDSQTATFAALRLWIDNWRWQGVPFYLRSGKLMSCRTTQIVVQFREPPHMLFGEGDCDGNRLVIQIQPAEGMKLELMSKVPDQGMRLHRTELDFRFQKHFPAGMPEAYERLLLDVMQGDASLFARADEVELAWSIIDPLMAAWASGAAPPLAEYEPGDWGPDYSIAWMRDQGRMWYDLCPVL